MSLLNSTSFPRKRESSGARLHDEDSYARYRERWIPAFAGMTYWRGSIL